MLGTFLLPLTQATLHHHVQLAQQTKNPSPSRMHAVDQPIKKSHKQRTLKNEKSELKCNKITSISQFDRADVYSY